MEWDGIGMDRVRIGKDKMGWNRLGVDRGYAVVRSWISSDPTC